MDKIIIELPKVDNYNPNLKATSKGLIIDAEATSPDPQTATIIQLAIIPFTFTDDLKICEVKKPIVMYNDPGGPIPEEIVRLTGITDKDVAGHSLDYEVIEKLFDDVDIVIAHKAEFDRTILERHVHVPNVVWGCSMYDIDWKSKFINSLVLEYIAFKTGFWFEAHDALNDCYALLRILAVGEYEGKSYFEELMEKAYAESWRVAINGTEYSDNQILKSFKFRWNPGEKYWYQRYVTDLENIRENLLPKLQKHTTTKKLEDIKQRWKMM